MQFLDDVIHTSSIVEDSVSMISTDGWLDEMTHGHRCVDACLQLDPLSVKEEKGTTEEREGKGTEKK